MKFYRFTKIAAVITVAAVLITVGMVSERASAKGKPASESEAGNNLSVPAIWSDGVYKPGFATDPTELFSGAFAYIDGYNWYLQKDPLNKWQASTHIPQDGTGNPTGLDVDWIDWGDNLEAKDWYETSIVRVETVLYQDTNNLGPLPGPLMGYEMRHISGQGMDEVWGSNKIKYESAQATVFSICARLTIQKIANLDANGDPVPENPYLTWNSAGGYWNGAIGSPFVNSGVWNVVEGPESPLNYSAEINVSGKVIYGFNWNIRDMGDGAGVYRLTFSLFDNVPATKAPYGLLTHFTSQTQIVEPEEEDVTAAAEDGDETSNPTGGGVATIDVANNLTYIDVTIRPKSHGGGNGNGNGGKKGKGKKIGFTK